jgi:3D (Asp-Asp-Asp) domain-containing protein
MRVGRATAPWALIALALVGLTGCSASASRPAHQDPAAKAATVPGPAPPPVVQLQLELPLVGLSRAGTVSYATTDGRPTLRGAVKPATATIYMRSPDGTRTALNPRADGSFAISARLQPGMNTFQFTAARLGAMSRSARLAIAWRGPAAARWARVVAADPVKYLAPASAGLNRKLAPIGNLPAVTASPRSVTLSFSLNTIRAPAPPPLGGGGKWLGGFELTEYYPALESWFVGRAVSAPGLGGQHRIDWLYSARGLSMEGDGIGLDGRQYHVGALGSGGWLTSTGTSTATFGGGADAPYWRTGGFWRNAAGRLTFPLFAGGWSAGVGAKYVPNPGITFAPGSSRPLAYLRSVAVDPSVIPLGSHIFIPAYQPVNGGWFEADDTGGAILGRHIDVFRPPPANPDDTGNFATGQRVYIVAPGLPLP